MWKKLKCQDVWREISNYLEDDLSPAKRRLLEAHFAQCRHCAALVDSTRNIIILIGDERAFELPQGFSARLRQRLEAEWQRK